MKKPTYKQDLQHLHRQAFGTANSKEKGVVIGELVKSLLADPTAQPRHSLIAVEQDTVVGHLLFTWVHIQGAASNIAAQILAPLAVYPDFQAKGIGGKLIMTGLDALRKSKTQLPSGTCISLDGTGTHARYYRHHKRKNPMRRNIAPARTLAGIRERANCSWITPE